MTRPASIEFALEGLRPNPTAEEPVVAFTLRRGGDASLDVLDLAGRRVVHRELWGSIRAATSCASAVRCRRACT